MIIERRLFADLAPYLDSPEAVIITGMRRTGKSTAMQYQYDRVSSDNKLLLDLENPLNRRYFEEENYERIKFTLTGLGLDFKQRAYVFIDEIQFMKNIPSVAKYFIDHYQTKFFLTGSASFTMKNLFSESLAGRKVIFELSPLSFREFLLFKASPIRLPAEPRELTRPLFETIAPLYDEYLLYGGFPGVVLKNTAEEKKKALDDIFTSFFQLEVLQFGDFRRNRVIRDLMLLLIERTGSRVDFSKLAADLKISRHTVKEYVSFLESTYFIALVHPYSKGRGVEIRKMPKVYVCDSGLAAHLGPVDIGHLFENSVYHALRSHGDVRFYRRKGGAEVDFVVDARAAYEVKATPRPTDLRKLEGAAAALGLADTRLVSMTWSDLDRAVYGFML